MLMWPTIVIDTTAGAAAAAASSSKQQQQQQPTAIATKSQCCSSCFIKPFTAAQSDRRTTHSNVHIMADIYFCLCNITLAGRILTTVCRLVKSVFFLFGSVVVLPNMLSQRSPCCWRSITEICIYFTQHETVRPMA